MCVEVSDIKKIHELVIHEVPIIASLPALQTIVNGKKNHEQAVTFFANGIRDADDQQIINRFTEECAGFIGEDAIATPAVRAHSPFLHLMFTQKNTFNQYPPEARQLNELSPKTLVDIFQAVSEAASFACQDSQIHRISVGATYEVWKSINPWHLQFVCLSEEEMSRANRIPITQASDNLQGLMLHNQRGMETAIIFAQQMPQNLSILLRELGFEVNHYTIQTSGAITYESRSQIWEILRESHILWPLIEDHAYESWHSNSLNYCNHSNANSLALVNEQKRRGTAISLVHENNRTSLAIMFGRKMGGYVEGGFDEGGDGKTIGGPAECWGHTVNRNSFAGDNCNYLKYCVAFYKNCFDILNKISNCRINPDNYQIFLNLTRHLNL